MDVGWKSAGLWSLNHDLTTSLRLSHVPNLPKIHSHLHRCNSVRVHPCAHPQHIKVLKHFVYIWYECEMQSMGFWSLNHDLTTSLGLSHVPNLPKIHPHLHRCNCKGALMCLSTLYQGANTLCINMVWMWDAIYGALEPQPWPYNITRTQPCSQFCKNPPPPA
jgi:hypothetical protein